MSGRSPSVKVQLKVPFHHCDPLSVVWHGRYAEYFEVARTELFTSVALDVPAIRELGYKMFITDLRCRYMFPLHYGDDFEVKATIRESTPFIRVSYEVENLTHQRKSARASTTLATTDAGGRLFSETPDALLDRIRA